MKIWAKTREFSEGKFLVVRRDGTIPAWPHFVLGARDPSAPHALRAYTAHMASRPGHDLEYVRSLLELADDFDTYRAAQGEGDPEAAPHRVDDLAVVSAMRGNAEVIRVRPGPNKAKPR